MSISIAKSSNEDYMHEVSETEHVEARYERLLQFYVILTHCNQAIARCKNAQELFDAICEIAVKHGGMKIAWVGKVDESGVRINHVARYGEGTDFLDKVFISVNENEPQGRGPSGTAIRENQPFWCDNFSTDPRMAPWHEIIVPYGWRATATVPLCLNGKPVAAFSMYSDQPNEFDQEAKNLLLRVAQDVSHALDIYEYEEERQRNEELLRGESLETLSERNAALREISQGVYIADEARNITYVNDAFTRITGFSRESVIGQRCSILHGPETCTKTIELARERLNAGQPFHGEILNYRKDGTPFWNDLSITPVLDEHGRFVQWIGVQRDITQRKINEARIVRLKNLYATLSHCNHAIVHSQNEHELFNAVCQSAVDNGGFTLAWIGILDEQEGKLIPAANYGKDEALLDKLIQHANANSVWAESPSNVTAKSGQPAWSQDFLNDPDTKTWHKIGEQHDMHAMAALPLFRNGKVFGNFTLYADTVNAFDEEARDLLLEMAQDVSFALDNFEKERLRHNAEMQLRQAATVFEQSKEAICITNNVPDIIMINRAFTDITGYTEEEVLGQNVWSKGMFGKNHELLEEVTATLEKTDFWQGELWGLRKNGEDFLVRLSISRIHDESGNHTHSIGTFTDITKDREAEDQMHWLSHFDPLTGLPNRTLFEDRCKQAIHVASAENEPLALMFLDLDHFKNINDSLGHRAGDLLLTKLANRLTSIAREQDTISRLGGDDFILLLPRTGPAIAGHLAESILAATAQPFMLEGQEVSISCSIGIAMFPNAAKDFDSLIQCADIAMFRAKEMGRNRFCFFTAEFQEQLVRTLQIENALRTALEGNQLSLHYQPQVNMENNRIVGAEALLRWHHPELGTVSPAEFIPIAESSGLIMPIGDWVIKTAIKKLKYWLDIGLPPLIMSVNVSAVQFLQKNFARNLAKTLEETGLPPVFLELELTESTTMEDPEAAIQVINELNQYGIRISIDDFGTGYSSLAHLKRFQIHKLKIDKSFVRDILDDPDDRVIVDAIIKLANSLSMKTIAEGVETAEQKSYLSEQGCDEFQGYYFSKPLKAAEIEALLRESAE